MPKKTRICIAVVTFKRPESLETTLQSLALLEIPENTELSLLVVDNDTSFSAKPIVEKLANRMPFPVHYASEGKKGIPYARNKALATAQDNDYVAFIDDDDTAATQWLSALYATALTHTADVVKGKVIYSFPENLDYLRTLDIFCSPSLPTGTRLDTAWTNSVFFSTSIYRQKGLQFDTDFRKTGGSDAHFFRLAATQGAKIVMCEEAVIHTHVPRERTTWRWIAKRHMRIGSTLTMSDIKTEGHIRAFRRVLFALRDSGQYFFRLARGTLQGTVPFMHPAMVLCFMLGRISGIFHLSPEEYN